MTRHTNPDPELTRALDAIRDGDVLHVKRTNGGNNWSRVVGPALAAPGHDLAIGIDLLDGEPHILRRSDGQVFGQVEILSVERMGRVVAFYRAGRLEVFAGGSGQ